jgi:hypothetical protein
MKFDTHYEKGKEENEQGEATTVAFNPLKTHKKRWFYTQGAKGISYNEVRCTNRAHLRIQVFYDMKQCCWVSDFQCFQGKGCLHLANTGNQSPIDTAPYSKRPESSETML